MKISLSDIGKRFNREWIFRHCTYIFETGGSYAITGPNGSGKSTVLQIIAGALMPSEGKITWEAAPPAGRPAPTGGSTTRRPATGGPDGLAADAGPGRPAAWAPVKPAPGGPAADAPVKPGLPIEPEKVYAQMAIAAPYLDVIEEMTLPEFLAFHAGFKPWLPGVTTRDIIRQIGLEAYPDKQIRYFSSGMKQRVKLAQAIFSDTQLLLLDEPCTNLDRAGYELYHRLIADYAAGRLVVVSSNDPAEYDFCRQILSITDFKSTRHHAGSTQ